MTDDIITRDEAIDRMKAGLPCETLDWAGTGVWKKTEWSDFNDAAAEFRKPPEPRRVARDYWIYNGDVFMHKVHPDAIHAREVLPGDVVLQRMTVDKVITILQLISGRFDNATHAGSVEWMTREATRRALGLIAEDK